MISYLQLQSKYWMIRLDFIMAATCPNFKGSGFQISDPIPNPHQLQTKLYLTISNPDSFKIQTSMGFHVTSFSNTLYYNRLSIRLDTRLDPSNLTLIHHFY